MIINYEKMRLISTTNVKAQHLVGKIFNFNMPLMAVGKITLWDEGSRPVVTFTKQGSRYVEGHEGDLSEHIVICSKNSEWEFAKA